MTINIEKLRSDMRYESRKFVLQLVVALAATAAATVELMTYFQPKPQPQLPQVIYLNPVAQPPPVP